MRSRVMKIESFFQLVWTSAELSILLLMLNFIFIPRALMEQSIFWLGLVLIGGW